MLRKNNNSGLATNGEWIRLKTRPSIKSDTTKKLSLVDLFCGCGGLSLGVWAAAYDLGYDLNIKLAIDVEAAPIEVYRDNFDCDESIAKKSDICDLIDGEIGAPRTFCESKLQNEIGPLDVLVAGPPCQGHSDLNNTTRRRDPRNALYLRAARAIEILKPKIALIENVPSVVHDSGNVVSKAIDILKRNGYFISDGIVRFDRFGVPQRRKRHILLAVKRAAVDLDTCINSAQVPSQCVRDYLIDIQNEPDEKVGAFYKASKMSAENKIRVNYLFDNDIYDLPNELRPTCHRDKKHSYVSMYGRMKWDEPAQTLTSGFGSMGQGRFVHPTRRRTLTAHEAARLQGFPDFFSFERIAKQTALREMIGNAVPPQISAVIIKALGEDGFLVENEKVSSP